MDPKFYTVSIEGHTDGDPYVGSKFKSDWDFSSGRAISFRDAMIEFEVNPLMDLCCGLRCHSTSETHP